MRLTPRFAFGIKRHLTLIIILLGMTQFEGVALAESVEDFKKVDGVEGCAGIPYADLARRCMDTMVDVNQQCKQINWSCAEGNIPSIRTNLAIATNLKTDIENLERSLTAQEKILSSAEGQDKGFIDDSIRDLKKRITEQKDKMKAAEERAAGARKETELRLAFGTKCLELRGAVMKYFQNTIDKAKNESDPEIKLIVERKMSKWQQSYEEHKQPIDDVTKGIRFCQNWLDGR
jgi:hypothetical protein